MNAGQTLFSQLMDFLPTHAFNRCVGRYRGDHRVRRFSCRDQFLCMAFAQLTYRESLRDIETCLRAFRHKLYHAGFRSRVARNTLARANENRDWRIYADFANVLIPRARQLYLNEDFGVALEQTVYAFDSTTIDLCLSLFPWAQFRRRKSAVKLHTLIDLRGNIPCFVHVSGGRMADVRSLDLLPIEAGAIYVMDRGYTDFARLYRFTQAMASFISSGQAQPGFRPPRIPQSRQVHRSAQRQHHPAVRAQDPDTLPRSAPADQLLCRRHQPALCLPDQQFLAACPDDRRALQVPLAGGIVLQMDQAVPADQGLLRHVCQCGQDTTLDRSLCLPVGRHRQEGTPNRPQHGRNPANSQHQPFRKNPAFNRPFRRKQRNMGETASHNQLLLFDF